MTYPLAPGYTIKPASLELAPDIHRLIVDVEMHEFGDPTGFTLEEVEGDIRSLDPERDTWLAVAPDGWLAGYGYLRDRQHVRLDLEVYVHPGHERKGVGTTLVRLAEERAREHIDLAPNGSRVVLHNWIDAGNSSACELLEGEGFTPYRYFFRMEMTLDGNLPAPEWPENLVVRACRPGEDEPVFYRTIEDAMADHWGFVPVTFEEWMERRTRSGFDPSIWFLVEDAGEPAAAATCSRCGRLRSAGWNAWLSAWMPRARLARRGCTSARGCISRSGTRSTGRSCGPGKTWPGRKVIMIMLNTSPG